MRDKADTSCGRGRAIEREGARATGVELFSGCGGLALGMARAGVDHRLLVEWNQRACETLALNKARGVAHALSWDARQVDAHRQPFLVEAVEHRLDAPPAMHRAAGPRRIGNELERDIALETRIERAKHAAERALPDQLAKFERSPVGGRCRIRVHERRQTSPRANRDAILIGIRGRLGERPIDDIAVGDGLRDREQGGRLTHLWAAIDCARRCSARATAMRAASAVGFSTSAAISW